MITHRRKTGPMHQHRPSETPNPGANLRTVSCSTISAVLPSARSMTGLLLASRPRSASWATGSTLRATHAPSSRAGRSQSTAADLPGATETLALICLSRAPVALAAAWQGNCRAIVAQAAAELRQVTARDHSLSKADEHAAVAPGRQAPRTRITPSRCYPACQAKSHRSDLALEIRVGPG